MKKKELFDKTIGILVKAYIDNTLQHTNCRACAVGNLVAHNMGYKFEINQENHELVWIDQTQDPMKTWYVSIIRNATKLPASAVSEINCTGYTVEEIRAIEFAFENAPDLINEWDVKNADKSGYIGLMSVCDTLMQIHEANETEISEVKQLFVLN